MRRCGRAKRGTSRKHLTACPLTSPRTFRHSVTEQPGLLRCPVRGGAQSLGPVGLRAPFQPSRSVVPRPATRALWTKARSKPGVPLSHADSAQPKPDLRSRRLGAPRHGRPRLAAPPPPRAQKYGPGPRLPPAATGRAQPTARVHPARPGRLPTFPALRELRRPSSDRGRRG